MSEPPFEIPKAPWPIRPLDKFFGNVAQRRTMAYESSVKNPDRWYKVHRWMLLRYLFVAAGIAVAGLTTHIPWFALPFWFFLVWSACWGAASVQSGGRNYLNGYLEGRSRMVVSMHEAAGRGMDAEEWLQAELERDQTIFLRAHMRD